MSDGSEGLGMMADMRQPLSGGGRPMHSSIESCFGARIGDTGGAGGSFAGAGGLRTSDGRPHSRRGVSVLGGMRGSVPKDLASLSEGKAP